MLRRLPRQVSIATLLTLLLTACSGGSGAHQPKAPPFTPGTRIVLGGATLDIGTPVVLWGDPIGFDAYQEKCWSVDQALPIEAEPGARLERYGHRRPSAEFDEKDRIRIAKSGFATTDLQHQITQFVLHYDAVGTSTRCFRALHDRRGLSVHFMLDVDGTIYQTLDVRERAFHAADQNEFSVGVEIAQIGAVSTPKLLLEWYSKDEDGRVRILFPAIRKPGQQRVRDVIFRPARDELIRGTIQGSRFVQYDYTPAQYRALAALAAGLSYALPEIRLQAPLDARGEVITTVLNEADRKNFRGVLGHFHVSPKKYDPGPAFQWKPFLETARKLRAGMEEAARIAQESKTTLQPEKAR